MYYSFKNILPHFVENVSANILPLQETKQRRIEDLQMHHKRFCDNYEDAEESYTVKNAQVNFAKILESFQYKIKNGEILIPCNQ